MQDIWEEIQDTNIIMIFTTDFIVAVAGNMSLIFLQSNFFLFFLLSLPDPYVP